METCIDELPSSSVNAVVSSNERNVPHILEFGDETLLHVIRYLHGREFDHGDLVNLALTCKRFDSLLQDRSLSEKIKVVWNLKVSRSAFVGYLKQRNRSELVTKLHITDLYWVPSGVLRDVVIQMPNLKELLTAGARLSWVHLKEILTSLNNIESLSWSWDSALEELIRKRGSVSPSSVRFRELLDLKPKFLNLKNLLLHCPLAINVAPTDLIVCSFTSFVYLISLFKNLCHLWVLSFPKTCQERKSSSNFFHEEFETDDFDLPNLKVLVVSVKDPPRIHVPKLMAKLLKNIERNKISPKVLWLDDPLINRPSLSARRGVPPADRLRPAVDFSLMERFSLPLMSDALRLNIPKRFPTCKALLISHGMPTIFILNGTFDGATQLESLCCEAFNFKLDWKKLPLYHPNIKEINLSKNEGVSYPDYCVALAQMTKLKRVSVPLETLVEIKDARILAEFADCVPQNNNSPVETRTYSLGFKKRRISTAPTPAAGVSGLQLLTNRCSSVEEIEIGYSNKSCHAGRLLVDNLIFINQWKNLKKLSLDGVPIKHGKYLIEIAKATSLESIRLSNVGPTGRCAYIADLADAVCHCPQLKDLRLQQNYMGSITLLLHALQKCSNLQRLLLWSSPNDVVLESDAVISLFVHCKKLVVFYAVIEPTLKIVCKKLRKLLTDTYKTERPSLSIVIEKSLEDDRIPTYPSVHFRQIVANRSQVCQYNDFPTFHVL